VNVVQLKSTHEERLRFRVILGLDGPAYQAANMGRGVYEVNFPPLTSFGNSHQYEKCLIKLEAATFVPSGVARPAWCADIPTIGFSYAKVGAISVVLSTPSAQTCHTEVNGLGAAAGAGNNLQAPEYGGRSDIGMFRCMVPVARIDVGDVTGNPATGVAADGAMLSWQGQGLGAIEPVMCGNPFGQKATIRLTNAGFGGSKLWIADVAGGAAPQNDGGEYALSFIIEMIPQPGIR